MAKSSEASYEAKELERNFQNEEAEIGLDKCHNCKSYSVVDEGLCDRCLHTCGHDDYSQE